MTIDDYLRLTAMYCLHTVQIKYKFKRKFLHCLGQETLLCYVHCSLVKTSVTLHSNPRPAIEKEKVKNKYFCDKNNLLLTCGTGMGSNPIRSHFCWHTERLI